MVVASGENAQVIGRGDGGAVLRREVTDGGVVTGDSSLLDIVASRSTGEETLVADNGIDVCGGTLEKVEESTAMESGLLEGKVELDALVLGGGEEGEDSLSLQTLGQRVGELDLGVKGVGSVPSLGQGKACVSVEH